MPGGEVSVPGQLHPSGRWVTVQIIIRGTRRLDMVVDSGSPVSAIAPDVGRHLLDAGLIREQDASGRYVLSEVTADGQPLPDIEVRMLPRLTRLGVVGLLGLDFLMNFARVCFDVRAFRLLLEEP